jgi:glycosyltransferase involved in cell wall biosynthesis
MRVLIVAPNISMRMGGEAALAYHYARELNRAGVKAACLTHARVRDELERDPISRDVGFHFVEDAPLERGLHQIGRRAPAALNDTIFDTAIGLSTLARLSRKARDLAKSFGADVIHQPAPVSPQFPSFLHDMPAPVVIGPLNGGMSYPPAFERAYSRGSRAAVGAARAVSGAANRLFAGKRSAAMVLVANERTRRALPRGVRAERVEILVENGVDLDLWSRAPQPPVEPVFVYVGRLVWWKGVELLIRAQNAVGANARLIVIGDGPERARLEREARAANAGRIEFRGFLPQSEIATILARSTALVLPSLRECGGAVILEAFASGIPAIATDWGGPQDYVTAETGILVPPVGEEGFIQGLASAMDALIKNPERARAMGAAARRRAERHYSWAAKAQAMIGLYERAIAARASKDSG